MSTTGVITGNAVATATILASAAGWLPSVAALFAIIWYILEIAQHPIVQAWLHKGKPHDNPKPPDQPAS